MIRVFRMWRYQVWANRVEERRERFRAEPYDFTAERRLNQAMLKCRIWRKRATS